MINKYLYDKGVINMINKYLYDELGGALSSHVMRSFRLHSERYGSVDEIDYKLLVEDFCGADTPSVLKDIVLYVLQENSLYVQQLMKIEMKKIGAK